ncbi:MAG: histidine kinase [Bacteroidota bacterium]
MMKYINERNIRYVGIVVVSLILPLVTEMPCKDERTKYLMTFAYTFSYWQGDIFILKYFRKKFSGIKLTTYRVITTVFFILVYTIVVKLILDFTFEYIGWVTNPDANSFYDGLRISIITTIIINALYEAFYFFSQWKKGMLEAEKLKTQQLKMELSVLKNQISPHFLFNSLNTLVTLIGEDQKIASEFTEKLSEVYRYILQNKEKELVKLQTEVAFVESYLFLLKMRFGNNLKFEKKIDKEQLEKYVPPLTLQILVENAIKHNIVSLSMPLTVEIYSHNASTLIVQNTLQKKKNVKDSTRTGLENIKKRYQFLTKQKLDIITTTNYFMVALPLIEVRENEMEPSI